MNGTWPPTGGASTLTQTSVGFGRSSFIALQDIVLQRTSSILATILQ